MNKLFLSRVPESKGKNCQWTEPEVSCISMMKVTNCSVSQFFSSSFKTSMYFWIRQDWTESLLFLKKNQVFCLLFKQTKENAGQPLLPGLGSKVQDRQSQQSTSVALICTLHRNRAKPWWSPCSELLWIPNQSSSVTHCSPHFLALHPPAQLRTPNIKGISTYLLKKRDSWRAGKESFAQLTLPLVDAARLSIVLSIKNSFSFISLECSRARPSMGCTGGYSTLTRHKPVKHLGMLVGLKQVSLIITVLYGQN